jgi:rubrerythrin
MIKTLDEEVAFTKAWWSNVSNNESKLIPWLRKLHGTEVGGFEDYQTFNATLNPDERTRKIFENIADDELKHGKIILEVIQSRGFVLGDPVPKSQYWSDMNVHISDIETAATVNYFGEALAAFRFQIILEHESTSLDIKNMLEQILPDEQFHRNTLRRMIPDETLEKYQQFHNTAVNRMKGIK